MEYYSTLKKEWNNTICSNIDGPRDYHTKWSQTEKDNYHMISLICQSKKRYTNKLVYKNRNRLTDIENQSLVTKGETREGRDKLEGWD